MFTFLLLLVSIVNNTLSQDVCIWGRQNLNNSLINGQYTNVGIYDSRPYYVKPFPGCGDSAYLWYWSPGNVWVITQDTPAPSPPSGFAACSTSSVDLENDCGSGMWAVGIWGIDSNVVATYGNCPEWICDMVQTTDVGNGCTDDFSIQVDRNVWSNAAGSMYWWFDENVFAWRCTETHCVGCPLCLSYAGTDAGWTANSEGSFVSLNFQHPTISPTLHDIHCIGVPTPNPTPANDPSITPTKFPTKFPTKYPTLSPSNDPTITPTKSASNNPSITPTQTPSKSPSKSPSKTPTKSPSKTPTTNPSKSPTKYPTTQPSDAPIKSAPISTISTYLPEQNRTETDVMPSLLMDSDETYLNINITKENFFFLVSGVLLTTFVCLCMIIVLLCCHCCPKKQKKNNKNVKYHIPKSVVRKSVVHKQYKMDKNSISLASYQEKVKQYDINNNDINNNHFNIVVNEEGVLGLDENNEIIHIEGYDRFDGNNNTISSQENFNHALNDANAINDIMLNDVIHEIETDGNHQ